MDIQEYPMDICAARGKVWSHIAGRKISSWTTMCLGFQMSGWQVNADECRFPKHFLPRHVPRQLKQTARRVTESARVLVESIKKKEKKIEEAWREL